MCQGPPPPNCFTRLLNSDFFLQIWPKIKSVDAPQKLFGGFKSVAKTNWGLGVNQAKKGWEPLSHHIAPSVI
jgi:hypothetical protein